MRFNAYGNGTPQLAIVWAVQPTCSAGASVGGWTVFVDLFTNGTWEGWVSYGHLDQVQVTPGHSISNGTVLGKLKNWGYSSCYQVNNDAGVHTHIEEWNKYRYACYFPWNSGDYLWYPTTLGWIGRTVYTSPKQPCW